MDCIPGGMNIRNAEPSKHCLEQVCGDKNYAGCCCCILLLLKHSSLAAAGHHASSKQGKKWTQPQSYEDHLVYHPLPLNKTVSREERMLSGEGQHRLGIYHFMSLHFNSGTHAGASSSSVQRKLLQEITSGLAFKIQKMYNNIFE